MSHKFLLLIPFILSCEMRLEKINSNPCILVGDRTFICEYKGIKYLKDCSFFDSCAAIRIEKGNNINEF